MRICQSKRAREIVAVEQFLRRVRPGVVAIALAMIWLSCRGPTIQYSTRLELSRDLHLGPSHPLFAEPTTGSFYSFFRTAAGFTIVNHLRKNHAAEASTRLFYLETNKDQVLDRTVKDFQLLRGRFGTVYVERTCFFNRPPESNWNYVSVHSYFNNSSTEIPSELSRPPENLPPLTSLSLVRILRTSPEYLIVAANYESNGELGSLHIDGAKDGDWLHSNFVPAAKDSFAQRIPKDRSSDALTKYGIPTRIDIVQYIGSHRIPLPSISSSQEMIVLNRHYAYNQLIQQDELKNGILVSSRFLQPSLTDEENVLNPECESRFQKQRTLGLPTVQ